MSYTLINKKATDILNSNFASNAYNFVTSRAFKQYATTATITADTTINVYGKHDDGDILILTMLCDATIRNITLGAGLKNPSSSPFALTVSKTIRITFISDGVNFFEQSRTAAY